MSAPPGCGFYNAAWSGGQWCTGVTTIYSSAAAVSGQGDRSDIMKFSSRDLPDGTISSSELKLHRLAGSLNKGQRVVTAPLLRAKPDQAGSLNIGEKGGESGSAGRVGRSGVPRPGMNPQVGRRARWWPSACAPTHIHQHHLTNNTYWVSS